MKKLKNFNGYAFFVAVMRELDPPFRTKILDQLKEKSPLLVRLYDEFEFIYNDLMRLDKKSAQIVLREIPEQDWLSAWKLTNEPLKTYLLKCMSDRKRTDFEEAFAIFNKTKLPRPQVVAKQAHIARKIKTMLSQGKISMKSKRFV